MGIPEVVVSVLLVLWFSVCCAAETITSGVDQGLRDSMPALAARPFETSPDISAKDLCDIVSNYPPGAPRLIHPRLEYGRTPMAAQRDGVRREDQPRTNRSTRCSNIIRYGFALL